MVRVNATNPPDTRQTKPLPATTPQTSQGAAAVLEHQSGYQGRTFKRHVTRAVKEKVAGILLALEPLSREDENDKQPSNALDLAAGTQQASPSAEDLLVQRSLLHIARTLEIRQHHAVPRIAEPIEKVLTYFHKWHLAGEGPADAIVRGFDVLCRGILDQSVYELIGQVRINQNGPEHPPHTKQPGLRYPTSESLVLVEGGRDPFTDMEVAPFFVATFPVTWREWQEFLDKCGWRGTAEWRARMQQVGNMEQSGFANLPAIEMRYMDCVAYCYWLWMTTPYRFRLPTEAEWNFAATGGKRQRFPWGDDVRLDYGRYDSSGGAPGPVPVDSLPPVGPYGLTGLSGNVWEYVSTLWLSDEPSTEGDIELPDLPLSLAFYKWWDPDVRVWCSEENWGELVRLVMKGGSWGSGPEYGTVERRIYSAFINRGAWGGFRLAVGAVRDPITGGYVPEPSPFTDMHIQQVKLVPSDNLKAGSFDAALSQALMFAESSSCPIKLDRPTTAPVASVDWGKLLNEGY
jgi:formylglycine-generating enzyme required for sulfatase activity